VTYAEHFQEIFHFARACVDPGHDALQIRKTFSELGECDLHFGMRVEVIDSIETIERSVMYSEKSWACVHTGH
jgi:hypothetical protein